jgi:hypothetical protein
MDDLEIVEEVAYCTRWLTDEYKNSNYYKEYLKLAFEALNETYTL